MGRIPLFLSLMWCPDTIIIPGWLQRQKGKRSAVQKGEVFLSLDVCARSQEFQCPQSQSFGAMVDTAEKSSPTSVQGAEPVKVKIPCSACQNLHLCIPNPIWESHLQAQTSSAELLRLFLEPWAEAGGKSHVCRRAVAVFQHEAQSWLQKKG